VAHPFHNNHIDVVNKTLAEIGAGNITTILVLNKIDLLEKQQDPVRPDELKGYYRAHGFEHVVFISAALKENIQELKDILFNEVKKKNLGIYPQVVES